MVMKSQNNRTAIATEDDCSNGEGASKKEVPEAKSRWQAEGPQLAQHLVSVKNVAGNTVHVIGAAVEASAPATPHRHQASLPVTGVSRMRDGCACARGAPGLEASAIASAVYRVGFADMRSCLVHSHVYTLVASEYCVT